MHIIVHRTILYNTHNNKWNYYRPAHWDSMKGVPLRNPFIIVSIIYIYIYIEVLRFNYRKTVYFLRIGTRKHAYADVMLTDHVTNSNYMAQKPLNFYIFFFMQRIDYIFIKKRDFNEICTMFLGWEKEGVIIY